MTQMLYSDIAGTLDSSQRCFVSEENSMFYCEIQEDGCQMSAQMCLHTFSNLITALQIFGFNRIL